MWPAPEYHLVAVWWSGSGWRSQSENHSHPPLSLCTEMGPSLSVRFLALPFSDTSWSCPVTTMIIVMIAVKDLLIMTLARSARAVRGEGLVPPLWIPTTPPALELELCPAICMFANHFKGSPLQVTLNQAQISVIFYFSSFLFSNVSPIYHLYFLYLLSLSIYIEKNIPRTLNLLFCINFMIKKPCLKFPKSAF